MIMPMPHHVEHWRPPRGCSSVKGYAASDRNPTLRKPTIEFVPAGRNRRNVNPLTGARSVLAIRNRQEAATSGAATAAAAASPRPVGRARVLGAEGGRPKRHLYAAAVGSGPEDPPVLGQKQEHVLDPVRQVMQGGIFGEVRGQRHQQIPAAHATMVAAVGVRDHSQKPSGTFPTGSSPAAAGVEELRVLQH